MPSLPELICVTNIRRRQKLSSLQTNESQPALRATLFLERPGHPQQGLLHQQLVRQRPVRLPIPSDHLAQRLELEVVSLLPALGRGVDNLFAFTVAAARLVQGELDAVVARLEGFEDDRGSLGAVLGGGRPSSK